MDLVNGFYMQLGGPLQIWRCLSSPNSLTDGVLRRQLSNSGGITSSYYVMYRMANKINMKKLVLLPKNVSKKIDRMIWETWGVLAERNK